MNSAASATRVVEISGRITSGMWDYGQLGLKGVVLPPVSIEAVTTIAQDGYAIDSVQMTTLSGTYVETAAHMVQGAPLLESFPMSDLIRPAKVMKLPRAGPRTLYGMDDLERHAPPLQDGDALIIDTGWGARWGEAGYLGDAPAFALETLEWFVRQPFSILGVDTPVMDCLWKTEADPLPAGDGPTDLLGRLYEARQGMLLLAPLVNLDQLRSTEGTVIAFPLALGGGVCSAPCRAAFVEGLQLAGRSPGR